MIEVKNPAPNANNSTVSSEDCGKNALDEPQNPPSGDAARPRRKERGKFISPVAWPILTRALGTERPSQIAAILGHGVSVQMVRDWRRQHCGVPAWVRDLIYQRLLEQAQEAKNMPIAAGRFAPIREALKRKSPAT